MKLFKFYLLAFLFIACSSNSDNPTILDPIVGVWTEIGDGTVALDGTDVFDPYEGVCVTLGRFAFEFDGTFRIEVFDGPDDNCTDNGVITGTWENTGDLYHLTVITDTSDYPETGQSADISMEFPDSDTMRWIFDTDAEGLDYTYEEYSRVE